MNIRYIELLTVFLFFSCSMRAQYAWQEQSYSGKLNFGENIHYNVEVQGSFSDDRTPLWLNANKYGLSSLDKNNGYLRGSVIRPLESDSARRWGVGYGIDVATTANYTSKIVVQQAFVEFRWLHGVLSVGPKQYPMELKNNMLSSGSQTLGINARPVPQIRLALPEYWVLPFGNDWLRLKGHIAFGKMTDDNWQHEFTGRQSKYADDVLYHSKAGYLMIGNPDRFFPLSLELGLEMATTFGGTSYQMIDGKMQVYATGGTGLKDYWNAFFPGGAESIEEGTAYTNVEGNQLGSWLARINYDADTWRFSVYADKFFEDHSAMFGFGYDGYGEGEEWNTKKKTRLLLYDVKDIMLGGELNFKYSRWINNVVVEYLYTKYQSGPIYHDHTQSISDCIGGEDNFYNHSIYTGWQHWGQSMGNPLYTSPIYNEDGTIEFKNNRFVAWHLGIDGRPVDQLSYRLLATYQIGYGTYSNPYTHPRHNVSAMLEMIYHFSHNWNVKGSFGMDAGSILGHNYGFQFTVSKSGIFNL